LNLSTSLSTLHVLHSIGLCLHKACTTTHNPPTLLRPAFPTMMTNNTVLIPSPVCGPLPETSTPLTDASST
jgi:hypothetical protein